MSIVSAAVAPAGLSACPERPTAPNPQASSPPAAPDLGGGGPLIDAATVAESAALQAAILAAARYDCRAFVTDEAAGFGGSDPTFDRMADIAEGFRHFKMLFAPAEDPAETPPRELAAVALAGGDYGLSMSGGLGGGLSTTM